MKFWKLSCVTIALSLATSANAAIINFAGYTHDTDTNIVTGNGLEWLQWDVTVGESINSIQSQLGTLEGGGWRVASNVEMAQLFNAFDFGLTFDSDENTSQSFLTGFSSGENELEHDKLFINMFGDTYAAGGFTHCYAGDCFEHASAWYGADRDNDAQYNYARVQDDSIDYPPYSYESPGIVTMYEDIYASTEIHSSMGVALVRTVTPVPVPPAVWLFGSGLLGLIGVARKKTRRMR